MKKKILLLFLILFVCLTTGCSKSGDSIVIYSSMEENRNQELLKQIKEEFPDIKIDLQAIATGNSAAKIKNEGSSTEADIVIDLETSHMQDLKNNFASLKDFDDNIYLDGVNTEENYITWVKYTMNLIIDKDYFEKNNLDVPETYDDLLDKQYKNLIAMPDPKTSGTGYAFYLNVINEKGEKEAIKYFEKLKKNLREFTTSGSGPTNLLKQGEIAIAMGMTSQGVEAINSGYNFEIVQLKTGSPYNTTSAGIIKGKEMKKNVKKVFKWLINNFGVYDKEYFMPDIILKDQKVSVKNYPTNLNDAKMDGIFSIEKKDELIKLWGEVNG